mgnify:CR=1 FL=1
MLLENNKIVLLMNMFRELMKTYNQNKCDNFIYDSCLLIYLIDSKKKDSVHFLDDVILKHINSDDIKNDICCKLLSNIYISNNLISFIIHYYFNNNISNNSLEEHIIEILNRQNYTQVIKQIFDNLNRKMINNIEELFNEEEKIEFFILLKKIQNLMHHQKFKLSRYIGIFTILKDEIINLKDKIINKLKIGNIKYDLIRSWLTDNKRKNLLIERLDILSFGNKNEINDCLKSLESDFNQINEVVKDARKLKEVLKEFFPIEQRENIKYLDNYENELKDKLLKEAKTKFNKSNSIKDLILNEMDKLKSSKIFFKILRKKKGDNLDNNEINTFKCAQKDYIKLRKLLDDNWEDNIIEIIEEFPFKGLSENEIEEELFILKKYLEMDNINELEIMNRKSRLFLIIQTKIEIISNLSNSFNFISEFATQNIGNSLNNLKDIIIKNINLELINKYNDNNLKEKYNLSENIYFKKKISHKKHNFDDINFNANSQLIKELNPEKEENKKLDEQIQPLEFSKINNNQQDSYSINVNRKFKTIDHKEEIISVIFQTGDQSINRRLTCKKTDIFADIEKQLYNEYTKFKKLKTYSLCNGRQICKHKTLEENGIKDNDIIIIYAHDPYED